MTSTHALRPPRGGVAWVLIALEGLLAVLALPAVFLLLLAPFMLAGDGFGADAILLEFLLPTLLALVINLVLPAAAAIGALLQTTWSRFLHPVVGALLAVSAVVQVLVAGLTPFQPINLTLGLLILGLGIVQFRLPPTASP